MRVVSIWTWCMGSRVRRYLLGPKTARHLESIGDGVQVSFYLWLFFVCAYYRTLPSWTTQTNHPLVKRQSRNEFLAHEANDTLVSKYIFFHGNMSKLIRSVPHYDKDSELITCTTLTSSRYYRISTDVGTPPGGRRNVPPGGWGEYFGSWNVLQIFSQYNR